MHTDWSRVGHGSGICILLGVAQCGAAFHLISRGTLLCSQLPSPPPQALSQLGRTCRRRGMECLPYLRHPILPPTCV